MGILATGMLRSNRIAARPLMAENDLKNDLKKTGAHLVKWSHKKFELVDPTFVGVEATTTLARFDVKWKKKVQVQCLDMVVSIMNQWVVKTLQTC